MGLVNTYAMPDGEWKTIRVPEEVYENAKDRKEAWGVTWGQYVSPHKWHSVFDAPNDAPGGEPVGDLEPFGGTVPDIDAQIDEAALAERIAEELKDGLSMANEPGVEVDVERLYERIDELQAQLPNDVADVVEGRLR